MQKAREGKPAKDTEDEHGGREAGGRTGEKGQGGGGLKKQEMLCKVRCHRGVRQDGALKSPWHLAIRRSCGDLSGSNFRGVQRGNT